MPRTSALCIQPSVRNHCAYANLSGMPLGSTQHTPAPETVFAPMVTSLLRVAWLLCACTVCGVQEQHALAESLANSRESELKELKVWWGHEWLEPRTAVEDTGSRQYVSTPVHGWECLQQLHV